MPQTRLSPPIPLPPTPLLSVVIPVYNERDTVRQLLDRVRAVVIPGWRMEIIAVDDGSTDGTGELLEDYFAATLSVLASATTTSTALATPVLNADLPRWRLLREVSNRGKGAALRRGFSQAHGDVILVQDADLEYDPSDYPALLEPIMNGRSRVVYGSRILNTANRGYSAIWFYLGGRLVTLATNLLYGSRLTDEPTGYKVFRRELLQQIPLECEGFEFCPEITAKLLRLGEPILEVPIRYMPRKPDQGKKIGWRDGVEALVTLWRWRWQSF